MPETITCSNPECKATIRVAGKAIGDIVNCPKCGTPNQVLASFDGFSDLELSEEEEHGAPDVTLHPARQICSNCGAVLGVRDATCRYCGADIRTGVAVITEKVEEKTSRPWIPVVIVVGVGLLILAAILIFKK